MYELFTDAIVRNIIRRVKKEKKKKKKANIFLAILDKTSNAAYFK